MSTKEDIGDIIDRQWEDRANSLEQVRRKLRSGWRNDSAVLNQYFQSCATNWKIYKGVRTPKQVLKLQAIYKQALYGDNPEYPPANLDSNAGLKWSAWHQLKGTSQEMAKRRFITFLSEIDPLLIDVMPDEKPPLGFPLDRKGQPICAKCNTIVGCSRPLLDQNKMNLKAQIFENDDLHEPEKFRVWVKNALANQRCVWGMHQAIANADKKPFLEWFNRDENRGFFAYDSSPLMLIIRELVTHHHEVTFEMMQNKESIEAADYNAQSIKTTKLKEVYEQLAGEEYTFEMVCERDNPDCNQRRVADNGKNHKHAVKIDPPTYADVNTMEEAIELRMQCQKLGINPSTGVVRDIKHRCDIYRARIAEHFEALKKAALARDRNELRAAAHKVEKLKVHALSRDMFERQCWEACHMNLVDHLLTLVRRGCDPNEESPKGLTPLMTLILNDAAVEQIEELIALKANVNHVNKFGLTPLMLACRLGDVKMVHILMRKNAAALQKGGVNGRSVLHWCVVHGCEDLVRTIVEYLKDGVGDAMRVTRFLDQQTDDGETPLMLAARVRNGAMCHLLAALGSNPNMRNSKGRNAAYLARGEGWAEIADWLEKKVGSGVAKLETFSDMQFEKQLRYGSIKLKEVICEFGKIYLTLLQNRISLHPLGCPFVSKSRVSELGEKELLSQRTFVDNHQFFIMQRDASDYDLNQKPRRVDGQLVLDPLDEESLKTLRDYLAEMLALVRVGMTNPNAEAPAKPLAWTALMCATAMNDVRSAKLLIREGANPNYPNRTGTTAPMLAAQLNNIDVLVELLVMGGDLAAVDNEGYSPLAYATSLPLPSFMQRDSVGVLLDGDTDGPKLLNSAELIKMALSCGVGVLKKAVQTNAEESQPLAVENHFKFVHLLEGYGLSGLHTEREVHDQVKTTGWRVKESELELRAARGDWDDLSVDTMSTMDSFERAAIHKYNEAVVAQQAVDEELARKRGEERCPICTLNVPCAHFFKLAALQKYLAKQNVHAAESAAMLENKRKTTTFHSGKKLKVKNRALEILEEAHLGDRDTDRSLTMARQYREKEIEVDKITEQRLLLESREKHQLRLEMDMGPSNESKQLKNGDKSELRNEMIVDAQQQTSSSTILLVAQTDGNNQFRLLNESSTAVTVKNVAEEVASMVIEPDLLVGPTSQNLTGIVSILKPTASAMSLLTTTDFSSSQPDDKESRGLGASKKSSRRVKFDLPSEEESLEEENEDEEGSSENSSAIGFRPSTSNSVVSTYSENSEGSSNDDSSRMSVSASSEETCLSEVSPTALPSGSDVDLSTAAPINLGFIPSDGSFHHSVGDNPIGPAKNRKVFMFTKDSIHRRGQTDGLIAPPPAHKLGYLAQLASKHSGLPIAAHVPINVQISGWVFVSMADLHSRVGALETVTLALDVWGGILTHIHEKFSEEWLSSILVEPLVEVKSWQPTAPRCAVCSIGFVRFRDSVSRFAENREEYQNKVDRKRTENLFDEHTLCLPCVIRKTLFERIASSLPRAFRASAQLTAWPFMEKTFGSASPKRVLRMLPGSPSSRPSSPSALDGGGDVMSLLSNPSGVFGGSMSEFEQALLFADSSTSHLLPSPVKSSKLAHIDQLEMQTVGNQHVYEAIDSLYGSSSPPRTPHERLLLGNGDNESVDSGVSFLTKNTVDEDTLHTASTISTLSVVDPVKRPKEMTLIPFLVAKGHFEEVERTLRITIGKTAVDEGEGMLVLLRLLRLQADMYKCMGLWPLALGLYLDCADLTYALLGYSDYSSLAAMSAVTLCLRQMQEVAAAGRYVKTLCRMIEANSLKAMRTEVTKTIWNQDKASVKEFLKSNAIWTDLIKPDLSTNSLTLRFASVLGIGGLYSLMTSCEGFSVVSKTAFLTHCTHLDPNKLGVFATFVDYCFRLRAASDGEVRRHLVQHLIQKQLAKSMITTSLVARKYRELTSPAHIDSVLQFLRFGIPLSVDAFDQLLLYSLKLLVPVFRTFLLYDEVGAIIRDNQIEVIAEAYDVSATVIQCMCRKRLARDRNCVMKGERLKQKEERRIQLMNHQKFRHKQGK